MQSVVDSWVCAEICPVVVALTTFKIISFTNQIQ